MENEFHPADFVDYHAVFSNAVTRLGKGMSVADALEGSIRELYPLIIKPRNLYSNREGSAGDSAWFSGESRHRFLIDAEKIRV